MISIWTSYYDQYMNFILWRHLRGTLALEMREISHLVFANLIWVIRMMMIWLRQWSRTIRMARGSGEGSWLFCHFSHAALDWECQDFWTIWRIIWLFSDLLMFQPWLEMCCLPFQTDEESLEDGWGSQRIFGWKDLHSNWDMMGEELQMLMFQS